MDERLAVEEHSDPREAIARMEARIEALTAKIENCRKYILASQVAVALGVLVILAGFSGLIRLDPMALAAAVVAVIGGIVLLGSNHSTAREAAAELDEAERQRAALIGTLDLHSVGAQDNVSIH